MKAAIVTGPNQIPVYGDFEEPVARPGMEVMTVHAAALSPITKVRAAGSHYSFSGTFPFIAGVDGVGQTQTGQRVFFFLPPAPFGSMAEKVLVANEFCLPLPADLDEVTAAAMANPGMSAMAALKYRAAFRAGETVLINGATGVAGRMAVQLSRHLGARKVIATGRNATMLRHLEQLGADVVINLLMEQAVLESAFAEQFAGEGVDIVLDYLFGQSAATLLAAAGRAIKGARPLRYVVIGDTSGQEITLSSPHLRSAPILVMGSGIGSLSLQDIRSAVSDVLHTAVPAQLQIDTLAVPLAEVGQTWNKEVGTARVVFVPHL